MAPASAIGPVTDAPTFSLLGLAALPQRGELEQRNAVWFGATQPVASVGRVKFSALGHGNWQVRDVVGANSGLEGSLALRARARVGGAQAWSAVSYGYANIEGVPGGGLLAGRIASISNGYLDGMRADTTVSNRVDVGHIGRAEAGLLTSVSGVELSFGLSMERATRVTTQTITIATDDGSPPAGPLAERAGVSTRTIRGLQRRDMATGIAAMGFNTGSASWLVSVTSPIANWVTSDALSPRPFIAPAMASVAVVQPLTAWLSVVGAASSHSASVGSSVLRDDVEGSRRSFAPVLALGVRIARLPRRGGDDTPDGILAFETHTIGGVDSASVNLGTAGPDGDTLRVLLLIDAPKADAIEVMGDATQWVVTPLHRLPSGRWRAELKLAPGAHRITVRADGGKWIAPPGLPIGSDDYGSPVGMIIVRGKRP
jgi:hypothetical protein